MPEGIILKGGSVRNQVLSLVLIFKERDGMWRLSDGGFLDWDDNKKRRRNSKQNAETQTQQSKNGDNDKQQTSQC